MKILPILLTILIACSIPSSTLQGTCRPLSSLWPKNRLVASLIAGACIYGASYAIFKSINKNKNITVNCFDSGKKDEELSKKETFLFAHGFAETHKQAYWYTKDKSPFPFIIDGRLFTYDYPDATTKPWRSHWIQTSLGQSNEIIALNNAYEQVIKALATENTINNSVILMGVSRGATTVLNFAGMYRPTQVKALIVESPFDSTRSLVKNILSKIYLDTIPYATTAGHYLLSGIFWQHSTCGACAIDAIDTIDKELPILLVCSEKDSVVPASSTLLLYKKLRKNGHNKVHIFIVKKSRHARILHGPDAQNYQSIVHAFYKKYNLSHDPLLAEKGHLLLENSQPDIKAYPKILCL